MSDIIPNLENMTDAEKLAVLESVHKSISQSKEIQKKRIGENVNLVIDALNKIDGDLRAKFDGVGNTLEQRVASIKDGRDGINGQDGKSGKDGRDGKQGAQGLNGQNGADGRNGLDGVDGVSVVNANIDFDGSLVITLSDGREINVGEVVSADVAEKIKVISTMSTNAAVGIKDEGTSISAGVKTINFVGAAVTATNSGDDVTVNVSAGTGTVTSVGLSGGTTGLTTTGSPITTTGTITLGGTLAVASGGTGTATPSLVAGTNITSITGSWPNQTINASGGSGTVTSVAATGGTGISVSGSPITTLGTLTITNTAPDQTVALTAGTGISTSGTYPNFTVTNSAPDQTVVLTGAGTTSITGTYPNFTISSADSTVGTVTSVALSGGTTGLTVSGSPITTSSTITLAGTLAVANGGTGVTTSTGTTNVVLSNSPTLVTPALGTPSSGVVTNLTGTANININGTVGATTASTGAFTTLSATGVTTVQAGTAALPAITTSGDTNTGIFFPAADTIAFATNGTERSRINSGGATLVNTTSATGSSQFVVAADTTSTNVMSVVNTRSTASTDYSIIFYRSGNIVGSVQTTLSATSFVTSSDYRLKEDIQPMTGALAKVAQLNPVTYKWKLDSTEAQGFIAHELQAVVPDCVTGLKDELDAEGNPKYQGIDTSFLVATLTAAIKEQQALITALTTRITALEAK